MWGFHIQIMIKGYLCGAAVAQRVESDSDRKVAGSNPSSGLS